MSSAQPILTVPLSPENEAATAKLESMARVLGEGVPALESYESENGALLARSSDFFHRQGEKLIKLAAEHHAILPAEVFKNITPIQVISVQPESTVYPDKGRVYKVSKGVDFFGYTIFCDNSDPQVPRFCMVPATPSEYLERLALANRVFGSDNRFEGITLDEQGHPHIVTSQHYFNSDGMPVLGKNEIDPFMAGKGFRYPYNSKKCEYRPADGLMAFDLREDNFKRTENGEVFPIDVIPFKANPEKFKAWGWEIRMPEGYKSPAPASNPGGTASLNREN